MVCSNPEVASSTVENEEMRRIWLWQQFAVHVTPTVQKVVEFAKRVPGKYEKLFIVVGDAGEFFAIFCVKFPQMLPHL